MIFSCKSCGKIQCLLVFFLMTISSYARSELSEGKPAVNNASPDESRIVEISGDGFSGANSVEFNGINASFKVMGDNLIRAYLPEAVKDKAKIVVKAPGGSVVFDYEKPHESESSKPGRMIVASVTPMSGPASGGVQIIIRGAGFKRRGLISVDFGGVPGEKVNVNGDDTISLIAPAHTAGPSQLTVRSADGAEVILDQSFNFIPPPSVVSLQPTVGPVAGGTVLKITGAGFSVSGVVSVAFGNAPPKQATVTNDTEMTIVTPPYILGPVDIYIVNPDGQSYTLKQAFTYLEAPVIKSIRAVSGR